MPDNITKLRTRLELASAALAEFIRFCRDDLTWNNDDPDFSVGSSDMAWCVLDQGWG